jgi:hypothetical protein
MKMVLTNKSTSNMPKLQKKNSKEPIPVMKSTRELASIEVDG